MKVLAEKRKILYIIIDVVFVAISIFLANSVSSSITTNCYIYVTAFSLVTLLVQLYQLKRMRNSVLSVIGVFMILLHLFHFGYYYIQAFGQNDYFIFNNFFDNNLEEKSKLGFLILAIIQAFHIGVIKSSSSVPMRYQEFKFARECTEEEKCRAAFIVGMVLMIVAAPCRLIWDIHAITESSLSGIYAGITATSGLLDDLQFLFIPALICIIWSKKNSKRFVKMVLMIYFMAAIFVMTASGARRQFVTGIFALIIAYYQIYYCEKGKKVNLVSVIGFGALCLILFNTLVMIRKYRHTSLGIIYLLTNHLDQFISLDVVWETLAEFGITVESMRYAFEFFPDTIPWQYGMTYVASTIYILPIGWLIKLNASVASMIYSVSGKAVGGSAITDIYANFGWVSILAAPILGMIISRLESVSSKSSELRSLIGLCTGSLILSYARGGTLEILRPIAYTFFIFYFVSKRILQSKRDAGKTIKLHNECD